MFPFPPPSPPTVEELELSLSAEDVEKCKATCPHPSCLESTFQHILRERKRERLHGFRAVEGQPLAHVLSLKGDIAGLEILGTIHAEFQHNGEKVVHELFNCKEMPQLVGPDGDLTLIGPDYLCEPEKACVPLLPSTRIVVNLFDTKGKMYTQETSKLDGDTHPHFGPLYRVDRAVRTLLIYCEPRPSRVLTLSYTANPFAVSCRLNMRVLDRNSDQLCSSDFVGKIVAKYPTGQCVLFDKVGTESEWMQNQLHLSRCWLALPAYSTIVVDVNLSKFGTDKKIVGTFSLTPEPCVSSDVILSSDYLLLMDAAWFSPDYDYNVNERKDASTSLTYPRVQPSPSPSPAVEVFSVVIHPMHATKKIHGSVEVLSKMQTICHLFKRDESDALIARSDRSIFIPLLEGSRSIGDALEMKVDIKDVENLLAVKGSLEWGSRFIDSGHNKLLCSLIRGKCGFAAVHYAIFPEAVEATIEVSLVEKHGHAVSDFSCHGHIAAGYDCFDYTSSRHIAAEYESSYSFDFYQSKLLQGTFSIENRDGASYKIPLSRSKVVVPSHSSLALSFELDLFSGSKRRLPRISATPKIQIGDTAKFVDLSDSLYDLRISVVWDEVK